MPGNEVKFDEGGEPILATSHMFHFSKEFIEEYLPTTVELGRSFVTLEYQFDRQLRSLATLHFHCPYLVFCGCAL